MYLNKSVLGVLALSAGTLATWGLLVGTTQNGDPFDSPLYWWSWILLPFLGAIVAAFVPERRSLIWVAAIFVPLLAMVAFDGLAASEPYGPSLWTVGEIFTLIEAVWSVAFVALGRQVGLWLRRARRPNASFGTYRQQ